MEGKPFFQCVKTSLKSVVKDEAIIEKLTNAALLTNRIMTHSLHFLKLYLIHCSDAGDALPTINKQSLVEYFDRAQDLAILLQERGITYDSEDIAMDVLQGLRERTDKANASFYTTLALAECSSLVDLRRRARNLHRVMPTAFTVQISLTTLERARGEESVRRMDTGPNPGINVTLLQSFACGAKTRWFSPSVFRRTEA